ncbi:hypothetical protein IEN85_05445 [Pelagicoccus sp. NFK12]|uniref:Transglutaminase-like domain-containing protein n=1 Tax=Pelagicoccus enzymogenes TaxID=2773457 RepID=A0A927F5S7_9BACT|nr:transglutaminase domain-containing protein [Pelagicoccus enzymogenes]MBD5778928.1 hypothetical protein [Pelagicoccus enzymogenes]
MTLKPPQATRPARITLSYWLALSSGLIAFAIVSQNPLLTLAIGGGSLALKCFPRSASKFVRYGSQFVFTLLVYTAALLPLWPEPYSDYYYSPLVLIFCVSLIAALNRFSYGGSRGVTSIAAIAFLLFIRNILLFFHFEAPLAELGYSLAFVALMEVALSPRFKDSEDHPHPELVFGLLLALVASFHFTSLPLGLVLAGLPIIAFLVRNHELAKIANEHTRPAHSLSPSAPSPAFALNRFALAGLPLLIAFLLYITALQAPFWGDFLPDNAPYFTKSVAQKANSISQASNLEDEIVTDTTNRVVNPQLIREKAKQIAQNWQGEPQQKPPPSGRENEGNNKRFSQNLRDDAAKPQPYDEDNFEYRLGPFARDRARPPSQTYDASEQGGGGLRFPQLSESRPQPSGQRRLDTGTPPTPDGLKPGVPGGLDTDISNFTGGPETGLASNSPSDESLSQLQRSATEPLAPEADSPTEDFDRFLDSFEQPEKAITQALNLEGSDVSALLSEEALAIVKLDSPRAAPRRLYLRSNVLDTVDRYGMGAIRGSEGRVELPADEDRILTLRSFRQSKSEGSSLTITSNQSRSPTLPLPESFGRIQVFGADTLNVYPEERVALAPRSEEPISYRVYEADLEVTDRERKGSSPSEAYRQRMLEVPLDSDDRAYLEKLAKRVGGSRSPTRQFAYRFANYFSHRHPYSYFVDIPPGPGHSVVRWLENESPGLCSNYAAAFVLLARSRGIPARVVGGFASDEFDSAEKRYIMRQRNAHAWVEFLDESDKWIRFDPTPGISETEIRRAEQYVTAGNPLSLMRLLAKEEQASSDKEDTDDRSSSPDSEPAQETEPPLELAKTESAEPVPTTPAESTPPQAKATSTPESGPGPENAAVTQTASPTPKPSQASPSKPETKPSTPPSPPAQQPTTNSENPNSTSRTANEDANPPWLLLLAVLALVIPTIAYLMRFKKPAPASPELQLRQQAGRLLAQLDSLLQQHELTDDPIWIETRQNLSEQRYGRDTNPILVEDLAVKVALLSKRKPN